MMREKKDIKTNTVINDKKIKDNLELVAKTKIDILFEKYETTRNGLKEELVETHRNKYGVNKITEGKKKTIFARLLSSFINPFSGILLVLAIVSTFTDIVLAEPGEKDPMTVVIIVTMVLISGVLKFVQEQRSDNAAERLLNMIETTTNVERLEKGKNEIPLDEVVVGDIVHIAAGDMVPADMRIIFAKDLFVSQSALTGESESVEKTAFTVENSNATLAEYNNIAFMGTNVISGTAMGIVVGVGDNTIFGEMAKSVTEEPVQTTFEKGVNSVSWLLIRFMLVMVPIVLFINGFTKGDWLDATLFAISVAVGLTPEMLPMIVTTSLAKGAVAMSKEKTIIKNLNSIQNLGSIDILCTDKTGTLTQDKVVLQHHLDINGNESSRVLRHAFLNSFYQTGLKNLMDRAIIEKTNELEETDKDLQGISKRFRKVDEIPFDFNRRRMSVVVANGKTQMITKGAVEEMIEVSSYVEFNGDVLPLTNERKEYILNKVDELNDKGMRVIAIAQKTNPSPIGEFGVKDEEDMVLMGFLAFLDPPKESTPKAIEALHEYGVEVKILTGDNEKVTKTVCKQVGLPSDNILLGSDIEKLTDKELEIEAEKTTIFAKLSPQQKARVITVLRNNGHSVGYMGDGINDAAGMKVSDVGISVDTAVDIAKESADVILLEKDLMVLEKGIIEGRKTYANMIKYIKMTASSNFGNMFSVLIASAFLPFMPMMSIHLLLLNLIYDISCIAIPWDNVDDDYLKIPRKWDASNIGKFMVWIGPTSSIFDITTYIIMYFVICPMAFGGQLFHELTSPAQQAGYIALFQAGWFVESMWSQTLVIHMIRTPKVPFVQSRASAPVVLLTFTGIIFSTIIPFTSFGKEIGLAPLPQIYFAFLAATIVLYMITVTVVKKIFIRKNGELL